MANLIPLEDTTADILGKAMRGLNKNAAEVARLAGVSEAEVAALREGHFDAAALRAVAPVLGLGGEALVLLGEGQWIPQPVQVEGLACFNTPFHDMTVNSYLAFDRKAGTAVAFDTGADCSEMLAFLKTEGLVLELILLTHSHADHILDLPKLRQATAAEAYTGRLEPVDAARLFEPGHSFACGGLKISSRSTWGHSKGGISYLIAGLEKPLAVVGDAVFAGSMGGGSVSYADALRTNREELLSLPAETVLCPGHGPLTTVAEERLHNPFFALGK
jgi:glyoxylase-like metal-dependent hydrolase (beta-lactamase superfamily II)